MPITWTHKPLTLSVQMTSGDVIDMIEQLTVDEQIEFVIELMTDFDVPALEVLRKRIDEWIVEAYRPGHPCIHGAAHRRGNK